MIKLINVTEENWLDVASLSVKDSQKGYLAPAIGILARGYVYRDCNARIFVVENDDIIIGVALVREFTDEPLGYDLQQFMIDRKYQGRGYGSAALGLILEELRKEGHYDHVEVCVKKEDVEAIHLYKKHGFVDSGYMDEDVPDSVNLICYLNKNDTYQQYIQILKEELKPAMGCTEPIAIAYAAAKARAVLGEMPERLEVAVSGNIIKNVKSVVVPHTGGLRGIPAAAAAGTAAGDADAELEVLSHVTEQDIQAIGRFLQATPVEVRHADTGHVFDIMITAFHGNDSSFVRILDYHTNLVSIKRNSEVLLEKEIVTREDGLTDRSCLSIEGIVDFADKVNVEDVREVLELQIKYNMAIAEEGLRHSYGANIGKTVLRGREYDINYKMRAWAAAGSDARMNGCEMPVVINSGSGNQGITASVPVIIYARETGKTHEELLRALCVSNLVTTHLKTGIGRLSAYCGAVSAGCGAGAGIAYLKGGRFEMIAHTVVNAVAVDSGIVCDGAKASCAAKIAAAVDAGLLGLAMYEDGNQFFGGDGIVKCGVENTIASVGRLARFGMEQTDREIIQMMMEN